MLRRSLIAGFAILLGLGSSAARADFFQITSLTPGTNGSFTGTLDGVAVTGGITSPPSSVFQINGPGPLSSWEVSNTTNTSPQYSYSSVYAFTTPLTDEVGVTKFPGGGPIQLAINFAQPMTNVVFQIANLDATEWDFSGTAGLTGMAILKGNGGGGDGLGLSGTTLLDLNVNTRIGQAQTDPPFTSGDRSGYGSVLLDGTYSNIVIDITENPGTTAGDGANFTLVSTPEPTSIALLVIIVAWFVNRTLLRLRRTV